MRNIGFMMPKENLAICCKHKRLVTGRGSALVIRDIDKEDGFSPLLELNVELELKGVSKRGFQLSRIVGVGDDLSVYAYVENTSTNVGEAAHGMIVRLDFGCRDVADSIQQSFLSAYQDTFQRCMEGSNEGLAVHHAN
jgi:hypothetical protein